MALFRKKQEPGPTAPPTPPSAPKEPPPPPITFLTDEEWPVTGPLLVSLRQGDWRLVQDAIDAEPDPRNRDNMIQMVSLVEHFPDEWVSSVPNSAIPLTVRGMVSMHEAWRKRGGGRAETVTQEGWRGFAEHLDLAAADLRRAAELDPASPYPWSAMVTVGMGLSLPKDDIVRFVAESDARFLGLLSTYRSAVVALAQKWGGSHRLMFDFVDDALRRLPDGNEGIAAVPKAHVEMYTYLRDFDKDKVAKRAYFKDPVIASDMAGCVNRSISSPSYVESLNLRSIQSHFAYCLVYITDVFPEHRPMAAELFLALGDLVPAQPWKLGERKGAAEALYPKLRRIALNRAEP